MNRWKSWRQARRRAAAWEENGGKDEEVARLKAMFAAARAHAPARDAWLWQRVKGRIQGLDRIQGLERQTAAAPFFSILAATGPRFAVGAVCAFLLTAGLYLSQAGLGGTAAAPEGGAARTAVAELADPDEVMEGALQVRDAGELLQFVAYAPPAR